MYNNIVEEKGKGDNMTKKKYEPNIKLAQLENQIKKATDQEELENLQKEYDKLSKIIQNTNFWDL